MAAAVAGGYEPLVEQQHILLYSEPSSPLQQSETAVDKLLLMAQYGLPIVHSPAPLMGGTGPITMASGLVLSLAEILSGLVVHQLESPGAPFVLAWFIMDKRRILPARFQPYGGHCTTGRWYGLPTWGYAGCSDAKLLDEQAAIEALLSLIMARLSGANPSRRGLYGSGDRIFEMIVRPTSWWLDRSHDEGSNQPRYAPLGRTASCRSDWPLPGHGSNAQAFP
jgi:trimethylamine--corrinoid protein Co-methyltransferase